MGGTAGIRNLQSFGAAVAGRGGATLRVMEAHYFICAPYADRSGPSAAWEIQIRHFPFDGIRGEIHTPGP